MSAVPAPATQSSSASPEPRTLNRTGAMLALVWPVQLLAVVGVLSANAQPFIARHFHTTEVVWFSLVFVLVSLKATPFAMRLGDIFGKRRVMLLLIGAGLVGDVVTALAPTYPVMLVGRAIGGLYGPVVPLAMASVRQIFPARRVAFVYGVLTGSIGLASLLSPLLAGWLVDNFGWQSALWALAASTALAGVLITLTPKTPRHGSMAGFDWLGGALLGTGMASLVYGIGQGGREGWTSTGALASILAGVVALTGFVARELRAKHPIVDLAMLRRRSVATVLAGPTVIQGAFFVSPAVLIFLALYPAIPHVSDGLGWSTTHNALIGLAAGIVTTAAGVGAGLLLHHLAPRSLWFASGALLAVGFLLAAFYHRDAAQIIATGTLIGFGGGMMVAVAGAMLVSVVSEQEQGAANGTSALLYQVAGALAYQLLFVVLGWHATVLKGTAFYLDAAFRDAYLLLAGIVALGLLLSLAMPRLDRPAHALR